MNGEALKHARLSKHWTQGKAAEAVGVTQAYWSMLETGSRIVSKAFARKALEVMDFPPTALPLLVKNPSQSTSAVRDYSADLAALGYPGFAYLGARPPKNPAQVLLDALNEANLDARVAEAMPWLALIFIDMDWEWLLRNAKLNDVQNRLGFTISLAEEIAQSRNDSSRARKFGPLLDALERARLAREDTFCHESMTQSERAWLRTHRSGLASHWNLLTDMEIKHLAYARS
jgi:transcriptional regulator with XRE-family HTH domain